MKQASKQMKQQKQKERQKMVQKSKLRERIAEETYRNIIIGPAVEELDIVGKLLLNLSVNFCDGRHICESKQSMS